MSDRDAPTSISLHEPIRRRWSPRSFAPRLVERDKLERVLEAARWAPSCHNEQPWRFMVATKESPDAHKALLACLNDWNQGWAKSAPVLMLSFAVLKFARNQNDNLHAWHDVGLATAHLTIQAVAEGLFTHPMGGIEREVIFKTYHIPEHVAPVAGIALGYLDTVDAMPEEYREAETAPRVRRPARESFFSGDWGRPLFADKT